MSSDSVLRALDWQTVLTGAPTGYQVDFGDRSDVDWRCGIGASTYGEMLPLSARRLFRWFAPTAQDVFFDLGSGSGRLAIQAVCETDVGRAVGVEVSAGRHRAALEARRRLATSLDAVASDELHRRLEFRGEDLRQTDLSDATLIWLASTAFPLPLLHATCRRIDNDAKRLRILATTRPFPEPWNRVFSEIGSLHLATSWAPRTRVHILRRRVHQS